MKIYTVVEAITLVEAIRGARKKCEDCPKFATFKLVNVADKKKRREMVLWNMFHESFLTR